MKPIAYITQSVIKLLNLDIASNTPVYIGKIISFPDYVGLTPKDASIFG